MKKLTIEQRDEIWKQFQDVTPSPFHSDDFDYYDWLNANTEEYTTDGKHTYKIIETKNANPCPECGGGMAVTEYGYKCIRPDCEDK